MDGTEGDFELHRHLGPVAPSAVAALAELAAVTEARGELHSEALDRLRQLQAAGLLESVPLALRREVERLLDDDR